MRGHNNTTSGNIRTILFVLCAILMVLCLLVLPWFCSSGEKSTKSPPESIPTTLPDPIDSGNDNPVTIPISSIPDNSGASIKTYPTNPDYRNPEENQIPNDPDVGYPNKSVSAPSNPGYCTPDAPSISPTNWDDAGEPEDEIYPTDPTVDNSDDGEDEPLYPGEDDHQEISNSQPTNPENEQSNENSRETDSEVTPELPAPDDYRPVEPTSEIDENGINGTRDPNWNRPTRSSDSNQSMLIVLLIILILLLISYIIARIKLKQGTLVITANLLDKILIILSPILFFIAWCIGFDHKLSSLQIILLCLSGIMLMVSIVFSILANMGSLWNIILSVMAKLFIFVFTNILLLLLIVVLVFSIMSTLMSHDDHEGTYIVKYDHFLDQWVGYRVD